MPKPHLALSLFAVVLSVLFNGTGLARASSVSVFADAAYGLGPNPCPAGSTDTGATTASASASCALGGNLSTASASVEGGTLAFERLSATVYAFAGRFATQANVHAGAAASVTLEHLEVLGADGPGYVEFDFDRTGSGTPAGCEQTACMFVDFSNHWPPGSGIGIGQRYALLVPYASEQAFSFTATLSVHAVASGGMGYLYPDSLSQGTTTLTLRSVEVLNDFGVPVPGASVVQREPSPYPEPASFLLVTAGGLLLAGLLARRRSRVADAHSASPTRLTP